MVSGRNGERGLKVEEMEHRRKGGLKCETV